MSGRILFLGGNGMIGSAAAREVVASGADLTDVTRSARAISRRRARW